MKLFFLLQLYIFVSLEGEHTLFYGTVTLVCASENKPSFLLDGIQNNL